MLLDVGVSILVSIFFAKQFSLPLMPMLIFGIIFSLLPDADFIFSKGQVRGKAAHQHRELLHYPLLFIPAGMLVVSLFDLHLAALFGIVTFLHFLHDSIGIGWGIQWLYPFSSNHYAFLYQYQGPKEKLPRKLFYSWRHADIPSLAERYGDEHWMKNIYLHLHPYAIAEFLVFIVSLYALWLHV